MDALVPRPGGRGDGRHADPAPATHRTRLPRTWCYWSRGVDTELFKPRDKDFHRTRRGRCSCTWAGWRSRRTSRRS
ncbi:MAG: hypothetical protein MZV65_19415 [Chromatiales bacterium]|nr:hypothetical protein [Chromatiales bacterium]